MVGVSMMQRLFPRRYCLAASLNKDDPSNEPKIIAHQKNVTIYL